MNIYDLISRAQKLRKETQLDSVSPDRVGGLHEDTLKYINEFQLLASSPSLHKIYASVSAMQSDKSPKSDLTGKPLKPGQLVVIVPANQTDATAGDVYRYDGPSGNTSAWTFVAKIGAVPADAELSATSTNPPQNKVVTEKLTELESETGILFNIPLPDSVGFFYNGTTFSYSELWRCTDLDVSAYDKASVRAKLSGAGNICITDNAGNVIETITEKNVDQETTINLENASHLYYCTMADSFDKSAIRLYKGKNATIVDFDNVILSQASYSIVSGNIPLANFQGAGTGEGLWVNLIWAADVYGVVVNSPIAQKIRIKKVNINTLAEEEISSHYVHPGINYLLIEKTSMSKEEYIGLDVEKGGLYFTQNGGVGILRGQQYPTWELSYNILIGNGQSEGGAVFNEEIINLDYQDGFFYEGIVYEDASNFKCCQVNISKYSSLLLNTIISGIVNCAITDIDGNVLVTMQGDSAKNRSIDLSLLKDAHWLYMTCVTDSVGSSFVKGVLSDKEKDNNITDLIQDTSILKKASIHWVALGDSFTNINDNASVLQRGYISKGYITRVCEKIPQLRYTNLGSGGEQIGYALNINIPSADLYTIMFGTNDFSNNNLVIGTKEQYMARQAIPNNFLANYGAVVQRLREINSKAKIIIMFPSSTSNFMSRDSADNILYVDGNTGTHQNGFTFADMRTALKECVVADNIEFVDFLRDSGISPNNTMRYAFVNVNGIKKRLPYPEFLEYVQEGVSLGWNAYNNSCNGTTYDGCHPSDLGCEIFARLLIPVIRRAIL